MGASAACSCMDRREMHSTDSFGPQHLRPRADEAEPLPLAEESSQGRRQRLPSSRDPDAPEAALHEPQCQEAPEREPPLATDRAVDVAAAAVEEVGSETTCKTMEDSRWIYQPHNNLSMGIRSEPTMDVFKNTGARLEPGDKFKAAAELQKDGITYLRLADGRGWVFDKNLQGLLCTKVDDKEDVPLGSTAPGREVDATGVSAASAAPGKDATAEEAEQQFLREKAKLRAQERRDEAKLREQQRIEAELEVKGRSGSFASRGSRSGSLEGQGAGGAGAGEAPELVKEQERKFREQEELERGEALRRTAEEAARERHRVEERERRESERLRVEAEKSKAEAAERERLKEEEERRLKVERERQAKEAASAEERERLQRLERERLRVEKEKRKAEALERERLWEEERKLQAHRERQDKEAKKSERLECERLRVEDEKRKAEAAEQARLEEEQRLQAERERQAKEAAAFAEEHERLERERLRVDEEKRKAEAAEHARLTEERRLQAERERVSEAAGGAEAASEAVKRDSEASSSVAEPRAETDDTQSFAQSLSFEKPRKRDSARLAMTSLFQRKDKRASGTEPVVMWMWGDLRLLAARNPLSWSNPKGVSIIVQDLEKVKQKDKQRPIMIRILGATNEPQKLTSVDAAIEFLGQLPQTENGSVVSDPPAA